jgi:hypothetical protein
MGMKRVLQAAAAYVLIVFAAGFVLGVVRTLWLAPRLGAPAAVAIELPVILAVSWFACARVLRRWTPTRLEALAVGAVAFVLLIGAELGLSVGLAGRSVAEHWALYRELSHQLGLMGQVLFAGWPYVQSRRGRARLAA